MKALVLKEVAQGEGALPLVAAEMPDPTVGEGDILVRLTACGVCHTDLDEIEGRIPNLSLPLIPGHQAVGRIRERGKKAQRFALGERVGIGWIYESCGRCSYCLTGRENLCDSFRATGRDVNGGYAEYLTVAEEFAYPIPDGFTDQEAAPLLCAGAIGYRSLRLAGPEAGRSLGFTGFGASAHITLQIARQRYPQSLICVFARSEHERRFAEELGADWTGSTDDDPPEKLDCIIDTTPAWKPVITALGNLRKGGRLVINAIQKEEGDKEWLLRLRYPQHLWLEKEIKTVANVTRSDITACLDIAEEMRLIPEHQVYPLRDAPRALQDLKERRIRGAKVLEI